MRRSIVKIKTLLIVLVALATAAFADDVAVRVAIKSQRIHMGEPVTFQIQVQGADRVSPPDTSHIKDFSMNFLGGSANNRMFSTYKNGKLETQTIHNFILNYKVTALKTGRLTIPSMTLHIGGKTYTTNPLTVIASKPETTSDVKITMVPGQTTLYAGQTTPLTITWYFNKNINQCNLSIPALNSPEFSITAPPEPENPQQGSYIELPLNGQRALGKLGTSTLNGEEYRTVTITRYITPQHAGTFSLQPASINCTAIVGYQNTGRRSAISDMFGDDFFGNDPFFSGRRPVTKRFFNSSKEITLNVKQLPTANQPANFSGLVGTYSIASQIEPDTASVGEPVTLTVMVASANSYDLINMPSLSAQSDIAKDFRISKDKPKVSERSGAKIFQQTIRAKNPNIKEFPPIELSYFNPQSGKYEIAKTKALPLKIKAAKIVTVNDIEGAGPTASTSTEVQSAQGGIMNNYTGEQCLVNQRFGLKQWLNSRGWLALLILPPLIYILLALGKMIIIRRSNTSGSRRAATALSKFRKAMSGIENNPNAALVMLENLNRYFSDRLGIESTSITFADIESTLQNNGVENELRDNIKKIYNHCEASRYAGGAVGQNISATFATNSVKVIEQADKILTEVL